MTFSPCLLTQSTSFILWFIDEAISIATVSSSWASCRPPGKWIYTNKTLICCFFYMLDLVRGGRNESYLLNNFAVFSSIPTDDWVCCTFFEVIANICWSLFLICKKYGSHLGGFMGRKVLARYISNLLCPQLYHEVTSFVSYCLWLLIKLLVRV